MDDRTSRLLQGLQYGLGALALWWLVTRIEFAQVSAVLGSLTLPTVVAIIAVSVVRLVARFWLWVALIGPTTVPRLRCAGFVDLTVALINQFFPSRITGRTVAPAVLRRWFPLEWGTATAITAAHTGLYALGYGLVAVLGTVALLGRVSWPVLAVVGCASLLYLTVGTVVVAIGMRLEGAERLAAVVGTAVAAIPYVDVEKAAIESRITGVAADTGDAFRERTTDRSALLQYGGALAVVFLVPGVRVWLLLGDLGTGIEPAVFIALYLVTAYSVTVLPLTPGGIGISEVSATLVFVAVGLPEAVAVPVIVVDRVLGAYGPALLGVYPALKVDLSGTGG